MEIGAWLKCCCITCPHLGAEYNLAVSPDGSSTSSYVNELPLSPLTSVLLQFPDRKRVCLRTADQNIPPNPFEERAAPLATSSTALPEAGPRHRVFTRTQPPPRDLPTPTHPHAQPPVTSHSTARFSELKRAYGDDAHNALRNSRAPGREYLSGRAIEYFPLLRPLPEGVPLSAPPPQVASVLARVFEAETVRRMPGGVTAAIAKAIDGERRNGADTAYLCGAVDNFCQKNVCPLALYMPDPSVTLWTWLCSHTHAHTQKMAAVCMGVV